MSNNLNVLIDDINFEIVKAIDGYGGIIINQWRGKVIVSFTIMKNSTTINGVYDLSYQEYLKLTGEELIDRINQFMVETFNDGQQT